MEDIPETFDLHRNMNITFQQNETNGLLDAVISLSSGGGGDGGGGGDELVASIAQRIVKRMRPPFDRRQAHPKTFEVTQAGSVPSQPANQPTRQPADQPTD